MVLGLYVISNLYEMSAFRNFMSQLEKAGICECFQYPGATDCLMADKQFGEVLLNGSS